MRSFLLGTDWWTDCDDAVALRLLCRGAKQKQFGLLGIGINACMEHSVASLRGFLRAEGMEDIPLGIDREATDFGGKPPYQKRLAEEFAPEINNDQAEDALQLYRRILAQCDQKIEILEIGYLQVLAKLLQSPPDEFSPLNGQELVREKVAKLWVMAGKWDGDGEKENNFCRNPRSRRAGEAFCRLCPVPVSFLGWEVGHGVISGGKLSHKDPLYRVLCDHHSEQGRHSWDPMLVLMAMLGEEAAGYSTVKGYARVEEATGANYFLKDPCGPHSYAVKRRPDVWYEEQINALL